MKTLNFTVSLILLASLASCKTAIRITPASSSTKPDTKPEQGSEEDPASLPQALIGSAEFSGKPRGISSTPEIVLKGIVIGDSVTLYSDSSCSTAISNSSSVSSTQLSVATSELAVGVTSIYSKVTRTEHSSPCVDTYLDYRRIQCPQGYSYSDRAEICVMKYEAKKSTEQYPESTANGLPWVNIDLYEASDACTSLNAKNSVTNKYDLISNSEWLEIAREIEHIASNWIHPTAPDESGIIGSGCLKQGNAGVSDGCGYEPWSVDSGESRNSLASLNLLSGETIVDLSGNVWEWVDFDKSIAGVQFGPTTCDNWWTNVTDFACIDFPENLWKPINGESYGYWGLGKARGGQEGALLRSGSYSSGANAGIYSFSMGDPASMQDSQVGFRCVYRP